MSIDFPCKCGCSQDEHLERNMGICSNHCYIAKEFCQKFEPDNLILLERIAHKGHYCPEWDYDLIDDTMPEFDVCICSDFKKEKKS